MKTKYILTIITLLWGVINASATSYSWNGSVSTSYSNNNNWTPTGIPDSADNVTISTGTYNLVLDQNRKVTNLTLSSKTIDLSTYTLTVYGTATMTSGTVTNGTFKCLGTLAAFNGTLMDCPVDAVCGSIRLSGSTFNEVADFTDLGTATGTGSGGCTFNDDVTITHSGTLTYFTLANSTGDVFNANVTFTNNSNRELYISTNGSTTFNGNVICNSTSTGGILFGNSGGTSTLASGKTISIGGSGFVADYLTLKNFTQSGTTAQTLTLTGTAIVNMISCTFNGNLTVTAPGFLLKNNTFNGTATLTRNGSSGNHQSDGGNTFNSSVLADNSGSSGRIRWASTTGDFFDGNATFNSSGNQDVQIAYAGTSEFKSNITINSNKVVFNTASGKVSFSGGNAQSLNGSYNYSFKKLVINKSSNHITANTTVSVDDTLFFVIGNLISTSTNLLTMKAGSVASGASNSSFVSGPMKKVGNSAFVFAVGSGNIYRPVGITAPFNSTDAFLAEFINTVQTYGANKDTSLVSIDPCDYWTLSRTTGSSNVKVSLHWNSNSCNISFPANERVASWNGTKWVDLGNDSFSGNLSGGFVKAINTSSSYTAFLLSNISNPYTGAPNLAVVDSFALLSSGNIFSDSTSFAIGKIGALQNVMNVESNDSILRYGNGNVLTALDSVSNIIYYVNGLQASTFNNINNDTINPGVYSFHGNLNLATMSLAGDSNSVYIFNISGSLHIDSGIVVNLNNVRSRNIYWIINGSINVDRYNFVAGNYFCKHEIYFKCPSNKLVSLFGLSDIYISCDSIDHGSNLFFSPNFQTYYYKSLSMACNYSFDGCNQILNSNFESYLNIPMSSGLINFACPWDTPTPNSGATPDYYTSVLNPFVSIPNNQLGCQNDNSTPGGSISGYAGIGFGAYGSCEYIEQPLYSTLIGGTKYYAEISISLSDKSNRSCNRMGMYFSNLHVNQVITNYITGVTPQISSNPSIQLNDDTNWMKVSGCFTANGNENFVTIGNFYNNILTSFPYHTQSSNGCIYGMGEPGIAYYYIDDPTVVPFSVNAGQDVTVECDGTVQLGLSTCITNYNTGQFTYAWTQISGPLNLGILSSTNIYNPILTVNNTTGIQATLVYQVTLTSNGGCSVSDYVTIISNSTLAVSLTPVSSCNGILGSITISVSGGVSPYSYLWNTSSTSANLNNLVSGTYTVTVTDNSGCTGTQSATILANTLAWDNTPPCIDAITDFTCTYSGSAGIPTYLWNFGDGTTSTTQNPSHTYVEPGYYEVMLTVNTPTCSDCFRKVIYVSPSCCAINPTIVTYLDATQVPDHITADITWDDSMFGAGNFKLNRTITVDPNVTLTIETNSIIQFGPEGRIILDRRNPTTSTGTGARMIMETNSRLTSIADCPVMWQGVEVWGNSIINHYNNANRNAHGFLVMDVNATIENAHIGVLLGKTLLPFGDGCNPPIDDIAYLPYDETFGGGILHADHVNFFNYNGIGVKMMPFPFNNATVIYLCSFEGGPVIDQGYTIGGTASYIYPSPRNPWYGNANLDGRSCDGIYLYKIRDLLIDNNDFHDIQIGIESFDARFRTSNNTFDDHQYGIDVSNTISTSANAFRCFQNNTFTNISHIGTGTACIGTTVNNAGIRIRGGINNKIQVNNIFGDILNASPQPNSSIGIQLLSCNGTRILDNRFGDLFFGIYSSGSFTTSGLIGLNTTGNIFTDVRNTGIFSLNNNPAMRLKCNIWTSPNTVCSGFACWWNFGTLPSQQGFAGLNTQSPAGNEWNLDNANALTQVNTGIFTYYSHAPDVFYPSVIPTLIGGLLYINGPNIFKDATSCVPAYLLIGIEESSSKLDSIEAVIDSVTSIQMHLLSGLDGGQTDILLEYIADSLMAQEALSDSLIINSPLSESVILDFLNYPYHLSDSIVFSVMQYNLPISNGIFDAFKSRLSGFSDSDLADSLVILYGDNPSIRTPFGLEREIERNTLEKNDFVDFIAYELAENDSKIALVEFLREQEDTNYKMQAVATAVEIDSLDLAREILTEIDIITTSDEYWADVIDIILSLKDSGKTVFSMDSTMIDRVMEIASSGLECQGTRNAQSILKLVYGIDFDEGEIEPSRYSNPHQIVEPDISNSKLFTSLTIYPNPADHTILVHLPVRKSVAQLKVFDITGKLITFIQLTPQMKSVEIITENYSNGIYQLLYVTENEYDAKKFVIQH